MSNVTRQAYARGVGEFLQQAGVTNIPTPELLKEACAYASQAISNEPSEDGVEHDDCIKVAQYIIAYSDQVRQTGKFASGARGASISNSASTAYGDLISGLYKQAAQSLDGGLVGVDNPTPNILSSSPDSMAKLDAHRPEGYAVVGQGNANFSEPQASRIGTEQPHPLQPTGVAGAATNSVVQATKSAGIGALLRKMAENSVITGHGNAPDNVVAGSNDAAAALDNHRPENYALVGQGNANIGEPQASRIGTEQPHPLQPTDVSGATSNSVVDATKSAAARWQAHFSATAHAVEPHLPAHMPFEEKVATIKQCMSLEPHQVDVYLQKVASHYAPQHSTVNSVLNSLSGLNRR